MEVKEESEIDEYSDIDKVIRKELEKIKLQKAIVKIIYLKREIFGSGFFLKFLPKKKIFHCLATNVHVINEIGIGKEILIKYANETKEISLKLNREKRIIRSFQDKNIDVIFIEIIEDDKIDDFYFLEVKRLNQPFENYIGKEIEVFHYPKGGSFALTKGKIIRMSNAFPDMFIHNSITELGSSGGPIFLRGEKKVIGIHKGKLENFRGNGGIFLKNIIDEISVEKSEDEANYQNCKKKKLSDSENNSVDILTDLFELMNIGKILIYHTLHPIGNVLHFFTCNRCHHSVKRHLEMKNVIGEWECLDCPIGHNRCSVPIYHNLNKN